MIGPTSASGWRFLPRLFRKGDPCRAVDRASTVPYTKPGISDGLLARTQTLFSVGLGGHLRPESTTWS